MMSLWKLFERSVQLYHKKTALVEVNRRISFDDLWEISRRMGRRLWKKAKKGIDSGKKFYRRNSCISWLFSDGAYCLSGELAAFGKRITEAFGEVPGCGIAQRSKIHGINAAGRGRECSFAGGDGFCLE